MSPQQKITKFINTVERIQSSRFVRNTTNIGFKLNFEVNSPLSQTIVGADEEDMRSMLIDLRKFTLKQDDVYLLDVMDQLIQISNEEDITKITEWRKAYEDFLSNKPPIPMTINGNSLTVFEIWEKWLYGYYFHENSNHQSYLENLNFSSPIHKYNFTLIVTSLIKISQAISLIAQEIIRQKDTKTKD